MTIEQEQLPQRLHIHELGDWQATSNNPDDDEFISFGKWAARDYHGEMFYTSQERAAIEHWLADNGYQVTSDNVHYEK